MKKDKEINLQEKLSEEELLWARKKLEIKKKLKRLKSK